MLLVASSFRKRDSFHPFSRGYFCPHHAILPLPAHPLRRGPRGLARVFVMQFRNCVGNS